MNILKSAVIGLAASGLIVSQTAVAASVVGARGGASIEQGEGLGGMAPGSAPIVALLVLMALVAGVMVIDGGDDETPVSP